MSKTNWEVYEETSKNEEKVFLEIAKDKVCASEEPKNSKKLIRKRLQSKVDQNIIGVV